MIEDKVIKPINFEENIRSQEAVVDGTMKPECFYCKKNPCYDLSVQGEKYLVRNFLYDGQRMICSECYTFMNRTGALVTKIIRLMLRIEIKLFRRTIGQRAVAAWKKEHGWRRFFRKKAE